MPTPDEIRARLATAQANRLTYAEQADLIDYAVAEAMTAGLPWVSIGIDGANKTRMTVPEAVALATKLRSLDSGGIVAQWAET